MTLEEIALSIAVLILVFGFYFWLSKIEKMIRDLNKKLDKRLKIAREKNE